MELEVSFHCFTFSLLFHSFNNLGPKWASTNLGLYVCLQCSGVHRGMGASVSFMKSVTLDTWQTDQIKVLFFEIPLPLSI